MNTITTHLQESLNEYRKAWHDRTPERDRDSGQLPESIPIDENDHAEILRYLVEPVGTGIWYVRMKWVDMGGISDYLWGKVAKLWVPLSEIDGESISKESGQEGLKKTQDLYRRITARLTTVMKVFAHIVASEQGDDTKYKRYASWRDREILNSIKKEEQEEIKNNYNEAYSIFRDYILHEDFKYIFSTDKAFLLKSGFIILNTGPARSTYVTMCSTNMPALDTMARFLKAAGKIQSWSIRKVHSIEDHIYKPYYGLLELACPLDIEREAGRSIFSSAISEYRAGRYDNCIRALGIQLEAYLKEVYETERKEAWSSKSAMLGVVWRKLNSIHEPVPELKDAKVAKDARNLRKRIKGIMSGIKATGGYKTEVVLRVLSEAEEMLQGLEIKRDSGKSKCIENDLFDQKLSELIQELIDYRNLASHRSHRTVGAFEAQRAAYCMVMFLDWWRTRRNSQ